MKQNQNKNRSLLYPKAGLWPIQHTGCSSFSGVNSRDLLACPHCRDCYTISLTSTYIFGLSVLVLLFTRLSWYSRVGSCFDLIKDLIWLLCFWLPCGAGLEPQWAEHTHASILSLLLIAAWLGAVITSTYFDFPVMMDYNMDFCTKNKPIFH